MAYVTCGAAEGVDSQSALDALMAAGSGLDVSSEALAGTLSAVMAAGKPLSVKLNGAAPPPPPPPSSVVTDSAYFEDYARLGVHALMLKDEPRTVA